MSVPPFEPTDDLNVRPAPRCLRPECGRVAAHRGLCPTCYGTARRLIAEKRTTWDALVANGKALPKATKYDRVPGKTITWLLS